MHRENDVCVLRVADLWPADMVCAAFDDEGIRYYRRLETSTGLELAMPAAPAGGPGVFFTVWVPMEVRDQATALIDDLPIDPERHDGVVPASGNSQAFWLMAAVGLVVVLFIQFQGCASLLRQFRP